MTTHYKMTNGRPACRPFALNAARTCSTIATANARAVTCQRCMKTPAYQTAAAAAVRLMAAPETR